MSTQPDEHDSLPRSAFDLAVRCAGFGVRTTVGLAGAAMHRTAVVADAAMSQTLTTVVDHVDLQQVVNQIDLDALLNRVDLQALLARLDLNAVLARVDLDSLIARLDTVGLARQVIDGVDLPEIIRESTGTMATESVGSLRLQTLQADDALSRVVDRIMRRTGRPTTTPSSAATG